ncbi:MAG: PAS domain-containing sensor histidine kinase [Rhodospirillales bacterium]
MTTTGRPRSRLAGRLPRHGLASKLALLVIVFIAVPLIVYGQFREADRDKAQLLLEAAQQHGRVVSRALAPLLASGTSTLPTLMERLNALADGTIKVRVLFRPANEVSESAFFYVAAAPQVERESLSQERSRLLDQGVLAGLDRSCDKDVPMALRYTAPRGGEELMISVTPVLTERGCWAVVTSLSGSGILGSSLGKPYWQATEVKLTMAIYLGMAALVIAVLVQIWRNLNRFSRVAREISERGPDAPSFGAQNMVPELDQVATAFDDMVESLRKLSDAIENSPSAVVVTDWRGVVEYINPAFAAITGFAAEEAVGRHVNLLKSDETPREVYDDLWATITRGAVWRGEMRNRRKDGTLYWAHLSISSSRKADGTITHFIGIHEDVTEQKLAAIALAEAKSQAELANRTKSDFLANVSHELRTPLNAILGFSEIVSDQLLGPCNVPQYIEYAQDIHTSGRHLLEVINDILDLSKLEAGKMELHEETLDLGQVIDASLRLVHERAAHHGVVLAVEAPVLPLLRGDARILKQALLNLLSNSIKFTPEGGSVTIRALVEANDDLCIEVADTGIGIAPEDLARVMEPYGQANTEVVRRHAGTGLGLPLVKKLIELHGGSVAIASSVGAGTTVTMRLPAERVLPPEEALPRYALAG